MPSEPATDQQLYHGATLAPVTAVKVVAAAILTIYAVQIGLYSAGMIELGAAVAGFGVVLGGLIVWAKRHGWSYAHLGVRRPRLVFVVASVLVGVSAWYVNGWIVAQLNPPGDASRLQQIVEQTPLVPTLLALALLPAVVEELVFRGVLTRALATRFAAVPAVGFSAAVFALYHLLPPQMVSTFCLGIALGFLTLRARSVIPAMIAHLLNNTVTLVVSRQEVPGLTQWMDSHTGSMLIGASVMLASGLTLAARGAA
jgi:membrane protease YdiL (CAAX protease family)